MFYKKTFHAKDNGCLEVACSQILLQYEVVNVPLYIPRCSSSDVSKGALQASQYRANIPTFNSVHVMDGLEEWAVPFLDDVVVADVDIDVVGAVGTSATASDASISKFMMKRGVAFRNLSSSPRWRSFCHLFSMLFSATMEKTALLLPSVLESRF